MRFILRGSTALASCTVFACTKDSNISRIYCYCHTAISVSSPHNNRAIIVHMEPIKDDGRPVALVTGGTSGIGKATARMLAVRGWRVIAVGLGADENIPETQRLGHSELLTYEMDVTKPADITRILGALPDWTLSSIARDSASPALRNAHQ